MRLNLYFQAPMQSWGTKEYWYKTRRTEAVPTKSAITGIICRCMGIDWENTEEIIEVEKSFKINKIFGYEIEREGSVERIIEKPTPFPHRMTDDQTIYIKDYIDVDIAKGFKTGNNREKYVNGIVASQLFTKDYLEDEKIGVVIEGTYKALSKIRQAVLHPFWPPYLGRACCVPSGPIIRGYVY